jgi:hypothetical protein
LKSGIVCEQRPHPFFCCFFPSTVHFLIPHKLFKPPFRPFPLLSFTFPSFTLSNHTTTLHSPCESI